MLFRRRLSTGGESEPRSVILQRSDRVPKLAVTRRLGPAFVAELPLKTLSLQAPALWCGEGHTAPYRIPPSSPVRAVSLSRLPHWIGFSSGIIHDAIFSTELTAVSSHAVLDRSIEARLL